MKEVVSRVLSFYQEATGKDSINFKESWEYQSPNPGDPYRAIVYGHTRFECAHVAIILPDGSRFMQKLRIVNPDVPIDQQVARLPMGKVYQVRWPGGETLPPEKRLGTLKYEYEEWIRGLPPMPAPYTVREADEEYEWSLDVPPSPFLSETN